MKRTTIFADEGMLDELKDLARHEKKSLAEILREAIEVYINSKKSKKKLSIIGIGESRCNDIAEVHEDVLWQKSLRGKQ